MKEIIRKKEVERKRVELIRKKIKIATRKHCSLKEIENGGWIIGFRGCTV